MKSNIEKIEAALDLIDSAKIELEGIEGGNQNDSLQARTMLVNAAGYLMVMMTSERLEQHREAAELVRESV